MTETTDATITVATEAVTEAATEAVVAVVEVEDALRLVKATGPAPSAARATLSADRVASSVARRSPQELR